MNKIETKLKQMLDTLIATQTDYDKFEGGNKSAGTRLRKSMQEIKTLAQEVRVEVQQQKNSVLV
tara:strand:- start:1247 stop:1438 length:192 start_codon:yes stop_codon:yes gene_type:complete